MAKVFIGMPVYNGERFIREAIDSLIAQSFTDWKLFISDDTSTDKTREICESYVKEDSRISYYRQPKNLGLFANFKYTLDQADGEYFMWAAQDDIRDKDYLDVCVSSLEKNKSLGLATTVMAIMDSFNRVLLEETGLVHLSGKPGYRSVARYILQPEILGKCNLMYGVFRLAVARDTWKAYPQRQVWGQDYMFSLALISRYEISVDSRVLWKKRRGGFSSPGALDNDNEDKPQELLYKNPKNQMFPFGRFKGYVSGHIEALRDTPYQALAVLLLILRLPRAFVIYLKERNFRKLLKKQ